MTQATVVQGKISIRVAEATDAEVIHGFIVELARYEKAEHEVLATVEDIRASIFADDSVVAGLIGEVDGEAAGFAVYFFNYSTWLGRNGLYLEDLYVAPDQRGTGLGKALLRGLAQIAVSKGCGRFEWSVLDWNEPAIGFYDRLGALPQPEWLGYRLSGPRLEAFAAGADTPL
ncbi:MAG: GNAT superfamily N-acetyltransferase [Halieaceae bacterium]|jgi:GNAT superfamily N-acetyltransferase